MQNAIHIPPTQPAHTKTALFGRTDPHLDRLSQGWHSRSTPKQKSCESLFVPGVQLHTWTDSSRVGSPDQRRTRNLVGVCLAVTINAKRGKGVAISKLENLSFHRPCWGIRTKKIHNVRNLLGIFYTQNRLSQG